MNHKNVKVTTTSGFDGVKIDQYFEPVTAHLAVGMNLFKDFLSGFIDFFGGRSKSYQNTLEAINNEAINQLRLKAHSLGANCIIGLKIDNDEISAQGKSMLMVTAIGTAAKAQFEEKNSGPVVSASESVSREHFKIVGQKLDYIKESQSENFRFDERFWDFVKKYQVVEVADFILKKYEKECNNFVPESLEQEIFAYFSQIDQGCATEKIFSQLLKKEASLEFKRKLSELVKKLNLLDFESVILLLNSSDFNTQKIGLSLLSSEKAVYFNKDLTLLQSIVDLLPSKFPERGRLSTKKRMLSSKEKEIWICECTEENDSGIIYCHNCSKDINGFTIEDFKLDQALIKLQKDLLTLREVIEYR